MSRDRPTPRRTALSAPRTGSRRRAALAVLPFLALGVFDVVLLLGWGLDPLWAFVVLPPILFVTVLAWIAFTTGFVDGPV